MNLRVDLILEDEQRSGSLLNAKSIIRLATIIVPLVIVGLLAWQVLIVAGLKYELNGLIMDWEIKKPQSEKAKMLTEEFTTHASILSELEGWRRSRIAWSDQVGQLMLIAPENVQLQDLNMNQALALFEEKMPARN